MAIRSFSDRETQEFFYTGKAGRKAGWGGVAVIARRKLDMLHYAAELRDLASPPGNRLEALKGSRQGYHSIRVNDQWRIVFRWTPSGPGEVEIADYH